MSVVGNAAALKLAEILRRRPMTTTGINYRCYRVAVWVATVIVQSVYTLRDSSLVW